MLNTLGNFIQESQTQQQVLMQQLITVVSANAASPSPRPGNRMFDSSRLLEKPKSFGSDSRESDAANWSDWSWSFEQYLTIVSGEFAAMIKHIRDNPDLPYDLNDLENSEESRQLAILLYSLLANLMKGRLLRLVQAVETGNGFEAYRKILADLEPRSRTRGLAMLNSILSFGVATTTADCLNHVRRYEKQVAENERTSGHELSADIKTATLLRIIPPEISTYMKLQIKEDSSYLDVRSTIESYCLASTDWSVLGSPAPGTGVAPMAVGQVKGKWKKQADGRWKWHNAPTHNDGNNDGKNKGGKGGKNDGKGMFKNYGGQSWFNSGHPGAWQFDGGKNKGGKSKGGKGKGKDQGGKSKGKGKGKGKDGKGQWQQGGDTAVGSKVVVMEIGNNLRGRKPRTTMAVAGGTSTTSTANGGVLLLSLSLSSRSSSSSNNNNSSQGSRKFPPLCLRRSSRNSLSNSLGR